MIHRYIHDILTTGVAAYQAEPVLLDDLFEQLYELEAKEIAKIKSYFARLGLNVYDGYPRLNAVHPFVCIILASEGEREEYIGDYAGMITEEGHALYGAEVEGSIWESVYHLPVVSENPDVTCWLYEMLKSIMLAGLRTLVEADCFKFAFSGMDLAPDPRYIPERFFVRQLTFKCHRQFSRIDRDSRLTKAFKVAGIHIDSSGSPSDVGGVETLVTPYGEGDDDDE